MSEFECKDEKKESSMEMELKRAGIIVQSDPTIIVQRKLKKGTFDVVIKLDVNENECLSRALARRVDPTTGTMYSLLENRPPVNQSPLVETLVNVRDIANNEVI